MWRWYQTSSRGKDYWTGIAWCALSSRALRELSEHSSTLLACGAEIPCVRLAPKQMDICRSTVR